MPDQPTLTHHRLEALELRGRPIPITSAELVLIQHWNGDQPAQLEWELVGRTRSELVEGGAQAIALVRDGRRFDGRIIIWASRSFGLTVFKGAGIGALRDAGTG